MTSAEVNCMLVFCVGMLSYIGGGHRWVSDFDFRLCFSNCLTGFMCGCRNLGEAIPRIREGAAMIRTKGEAGTGNIVEAVRHVHSVMGDICSLRSMEYDEVFAYTKKIAAHHHHHHHIIRTLDSEIDLEIDADVDPDDPSSSVNPSHSEDDQKHLLLLSQIGADDSPDIGGLHQPKRKKKVVKKWRDEWTDTYKWAYVDVNEGSTRIFCSVCREYGRKHRRNPYGNEGSRNMQMSALEEHNNSLLHKEALRLQMASKDKSMPAVARPVYVALMSKTAGSIVESVVRRDPHEVEYIQYVQEVVHSLEPVLMKNTQYIHILERFLEAERVFVFRVPWADDRGETHVSRGFRVQFSQALGPCRGSLRFHPSMNLSIAKFLALEQYRFVNSP